MNSRGVTRKGGEKTERETDSASLLEGSQASSARPSSRSSMKMRM